MVFHQESFQNCKKRSICGVPAVEQVRVDINPPLRIFDIR